MTPSKLSFSLQTNLQKRSIQGVRAKQPNDSNLFHWDKVHNNWFNCSIRPTCVYGFGRGVEPSFRSPTWLQLQYWLTVLVRACNYTSYTIFGHELNKQKHFGNSFITFGIVLYLLSISTDEIYRISTRINNTYFWCKFSENDNALFTPIPAL